MTPFVVKTALPDVKWRPALPEEAVCAPTGDLEGSIDTFAKLHCEVCNAEVGELHGGRCVVCHANRPPTVSLRSVLDEASAIVDGARRESYGAPRENHLRTAAMWSAYLGIEITPRQVCMLNALQKISRDAHRPSRDNLVDLAGYARNAELVEVRP